MSRVNRVEQELKTDDSELISAASSPATTSPRMPSGSSAPMRTGSAWSGLVEGDLPAGCERVGDDARYDEDEERQQLEQPAEDRSPPSVVLVRRGQHALNDELVGAPVPDAEDRRAQKDSRPREVRIRERLPDGHEARSGFFDHRAPAAELAEPDPGDRDRTADQHEHLQQVRVEDRPQPAQHRVDPRRDDDDEGAGPEVDAHQRLEDDAPRRDGHGDLGQHVADDRDHREVPARRRRVPALEELGHREDAAPQVERDEDPAQHQQDQGREDLELPHRHAARGAGAGESHQVLGPDVRGKERGADDEPADVAAREEVVRRARLLPSLRNGRPRRDPEDRDEVEGDDDPVQPFKSAHGAEHTSPANSAG